MASIEKIKASDGSGNATIATVQSSRAPLASTINVDTVIGINPGGFMGTMGTPHTFTDPITSETITVISEATAVDFTGHVDGSNLEIDTIAPGYVDAGSEVGDIVIIRPTTQYADSLATILAVAHSDDGSLKDDVITTSKVSNASITPDKLATGADSNYAAGTSSTTSAVYDLLADGLSTAVTVNVGANGKALVSISARMSVNTGSFSGWMGFSISDATTIAATDEMACEYQSWDTNTADTRAATFVVKGLTPGSTTFTLQYHTNATLTCTYRRIGVIPI